MHKFFDGIFLIKVLIVVLGLAILGCFAGLVYGIRHYKTTPKVLSRTLPVKPKPAVVKELPLAADKIKDAVSCGKFFCVTVADAVKGDRIAVIDVSDRKIVYWIVAGQPTATGDSVSE